MRTADIVALRLTYQKLALNKLSCGYVPDLTGFTATDGLTIGNYERFVSGF
jgi:hypothetical protein